jgi:pimeloyl-ACP methyl ester carboxylesterase
LAADNNALLIVLEHRFYGGSRPRHNFLSQDYLYLSSDQALADTKNFLLRHVKGSETGHPYTKLVQHASLNAKGKVVLFGGGYAGTLAAWFRQQHPGVADAAVAVSAPMVQTYEFSSFFSVFEEGSAAFSSIPDGATCQANLRSSLTTLHQMLQDTTSASWTKSSGFCPGEAGPGGTTWCGGQRMM